jgi:phosphatidate phosphatase APP1
VGSTRFIKLYKGYGHAHDLHIYGHVVKKLPPLRDRSKNSLLHNAAYLLRVFFVRPLPEVQVSLDTINRTIETETATDGFFSFEWSEGQEIPAGWHKVTASITGEVEKTEGEVFIPHSTQLALISDIDDTILISHSSSAMKKLYQLFFRSPDKRKVFDDVASLYHALSLAQTTPEMPNPFFYVSSSEWNLYDYLDEIFDKHRMPAGVFLLNEIKRWYELFKTGKTKHEGKLMRIVRVFKAFPKQKFILLGDNSQSDPAIYEKLTERYGDKIIAVLIRNVREQKVETTQALLDKIALRGVKTCFYSNSNVALAFAKKAGIV